MINFNDDNNLINFDKRYLKNRYKRIRIGMEEKTLPGSAEFLGWSEMLENYDYSNIDNILNTTSNLHKKAKIMIVIGIGGSYLGAKAIYEALEGLELFNEYKLFFVGNNISSDYIGQIYAHCWDNDFVVNVISKSGTTLESAISFRIFKELLEKKYPEEKINERIIITTDPENGPLRQFAIDNEIKTFDIPKNIGGRYSVFTPVGLLPLAFAKINVKELIRGAIQAAKDNNTDDSDNTAYNYAVNRLMLSTVGAKTVESFVTYEPALHYYTEWLKQLFAESEGKEGKGLLPINMTYTTDLHSLGQMVQEGKKILFETVFKVKECKFNLKLPEFEDDFDNLNKYTKYGLCEINDKAAIGVMQAHVKGEVPNLIFEMDKIDEYNLAYLMQTMMYATTYSAYLLKVNPFDQPGVELYKKEIHKILEEETK